MDESVLFAIIFVVRVYHVYIVDVSILFLFQSQRTFRQRGTYLLGERAKNLKNRMKVNKEGKKSNDVKRKNFAVHRILSGYLSARLKGRRI